MTSHTQKLQLSSLQLVDFFLYTKNLIKNSRKAFVENLCSSSSKIQIQQVLQFIVEKIEDKKKMSIDKFIALISIFVYVNVMGQCQIFGIRYNEAFYHNLKFYVQNVFDSWAQIQNSTEKSNPKTNLSILFCSLSSLVEENSKNTIDIDIKKVLSPALLKSLLSVKLPNDQKILRNYKNLIFYISKQKIPKFLRKPYLRSLGHHLSSCPVSKNMQITAIFLLNKFIEDNKLVNQIGEIWSIEELTKIISTCVQIVLNSTQSIQLKLVLEFCFKLISKLPTLPENIVDGQQFMKLYTQIYKNVNSDKLCPCLQQILMKISPSSCSMIFKQISAEELHSTVHFQILENCTKKISQSCVFEIVQSGKWQKLLVELQELTGSSYKKYLLTKIITNIINSCHENEDLQFILRNLYNQSINSSQWKTTH